MSRHGDSPRGAVACKQRLSGYGSDDLSRQTATAVLVYCLYLLPRFGSRRGADNLFAGGDINYNPFDVYGRVSARSEVHVHVTATAVERTTTSVGDAGGGARKDFPGF